MIERDMTAAAQRRQADLICDLRAGAQALDRKHALALAAGVLHDVLQDGITGADIASPANAERYARRALNALNRTGY
jgi:hypothetical protein